MPELIITATGPDRPGLVGEFTGGLLAAGGNIADSRMVNLRGRFALIVLVEADAAAIERLRQAAADAGKQTGLQVVIEDHGPALRAITGMPFRLKTYSLDQPGIVHQVSQLLCRHGVNIEDLSTRLTSAPFDGTPLFTMEMRLTVPATVAIQQLRTDVEALCATLNCDVDIELAKE
jgi:glycine cleavage system transcriptional repressor